MNSKNLLYFPGNFKTQPEPQTNSPVDLPDWLLEELYKVQAAWGVPVRILIIDQLENFVADTWDFESDSPRQQKWNVEKARKRKPRVNGAFKALPKKLL